MPRKQVLRATWVAAALLIVFASIGCGGNRTDNAVARSRNIQPEPESFRIALPLDVSKAVSLEDADRFCNGADYASELPSQRVTPQGTQLLFSPSWDEGGEPGPGDLAFAMYLFSLDGYEDLPELAMQWGLAPADWGCCFVGLGNQVYNRWDWFTDEDIAEALLTLEDIAPYLDGYGGLVMIVLMTGTDSCTLAWLRWGGNVAPIAVLEADPLSGSPPLAVGFNANASYDPDGSLTDFEWDFDGDGAFNETGPEADARSIPTANYTYNDAGNYMAAVRVTDDYGAQDTATVNINVIPGQSGWVLVTVVDYEGLVNSFYPSVAVVNGCPAICYCVKPYGDDDEIRFTISATPSGINAADWCEPVLVDAGDGLCNWSSLAEVDGNPAIAYHAGLPGSRYARSTTSSGTDAADWSQVVTFNDYPQMPSLVVVAGNPAIAYGYENKLCYRRATTSTGATSGEWAESLVIEEGT